MVGRRSVRLLMNLLSFSILFPAAVQAQPPLWVQQLNTNKDAQASGVAADGQGNVYVSGHTFGAFKGSTNQGDSDAFVAKINANGKAVWKQQLGTSGLDQARGIATDRNGNILIAGVTSGSLDGTNYGAEDAFVAKYAPNGSLLWKKQLGALGIDQARGVATDGNGNVYISGVTYGSLEGAQQGNGDAFLTKYRADGTLLWTRQLGTTSADLSRGVATDRQGNVFISGVTAGQLGGKNQGLTDAFVAKYRADGALLWKKQLGTRLVDESHGVATDRNGNVYLSGLTYGSLDGANKGSADAFAAKFNASGTLLWQEQLGTLGFDESNGVATDWHGNVYIAGLAYGSLDGPYQGKGDAFVAKYATDGTLLKIEQLGTDNLDESRGVAIDKDGKVYIAGYTQSDLEGPNKRGSDPFVAKY